MDKQAIDKQAMICALSYLELKPIIKTAGAGLWWKLGLPIIGGLAGWAYHQNALKNSYRQGNTELMAELRPLIAGLRAPQGAYSLPGGNGFA